MERRLAAILTADMVNYSRLMGQDEIGTLARLSEHRTRVIDPTINQQEGRIVKTTGDGLLVEFSDPIDAVTCALTAQQEIANGNDSLPEDQRIVFRFGVNFSNVIDQDGDIYGDGVNIAARLEGLCEPGGVLISQSVFEALHENLADVFADCGPQKLKNIAQPITVWSWPRRLPADRHDKKPFVLIGNFAGRSGEEQSLAEDLQAELTVALSRLTGLEVVVDQKKAEYVLKGNVRCAAGHIRISPQLVSIEDDRQIWAERFDEATDNPFEVLDNCVPRITIRVRRLVGDEDADRLAGKDLNNLSTEQLLSLSGATFRVPTKENWIHAGEIAGHALERAPDHFMALALSATSAAAELWLGYKALDEPTTAQAFERIRGMSRSMLKS